MRREEQYLLDMIEAADEIAEYLAWIEREHFLGNRMFAQRRAPSAHGDRGSRRPLASGSG